VGLTNTSLSGNLMVPFLRFKDVSYRGI